MGFIQEVLMKFDKWISRQGWICRKARPRLGWTIGCLSCLVLQGSCEWDGSSTMRLLKKAASGVLAIFPCSRTGSTLCAQK